MDTVKFRIIQGLIITTKSRLAFEKEKQITLKVDGKANKSSIKYAIEALWDVKVKQVRTMNVKGRTKRFAGKFFQSSGYKKAIVSLKDGYNIDLPWLQQQIVPDVNVVNNRKQDGE